MIIVDVAAGFNAYDSRLNKLYLEKFKVKLMRNQHSTPKIKFIKVHTVRSTWLEDIIPEARHNMSRLATLYF